MATAAVAGLRVYKFGGASVKDAASIRNVCRIVQETALGQPLVVVVSAMGKTTNALEAVAHLAHFPEKGDFETALQPIEHLHLTTLQELLSGPALAAATADVAALFAELRQHLRAGNPQNAPVGQFYDQVVSFGELLATRLVAHALGAPWLDCRQVVRTDHTYQAANVDWETTAQLLPAAVLPLLAQSLVVTQGFIGGTADGRTTTLGREGSDYSAAIFAYCLGAESVTIWKDVPGLLNADPRFFADTVLYPEISYQEAIEMAYYGASVIHPKTVQPLAKRGIPLYVKSFLDPRAPGTIIHDCLHPTLAPAIIRKPQQLLVSFQRRDAAFISAADLSSIFDKLAQLRIALNMMQNSAISFSICFDQHREKLEKLLALADEFSIHYNTDLTLFTLKNYDQASLTRLSSGRELLLEQRTRSTFQFLVRE